LESSAAANVPYYQNRGFEEKRVIKLVRGPKPVLMHIMVREPQNGKQSQSGKGEGSVGARDGVL